MTDPARFVVLIDNNEGGPPATLHPTLESAIEWIRTFLAEGDPPLDDEERANTERDLARLTGEYPQSVRGSEAWKESIYVAPLAVTEAVPRPDISEAMVEAAARAWEWANLELRRKVDYDAPENLPLDRDDLARARAALEAALGQCLKVPRGTATGGE